MVAHPLQLVGDVVQREQEAQVAGDRRLGRDRRGDHRRDLALELVDRGVAADDRHARRVVVGDDRGERGADLALHERAHPQDVVLDLGHLAVEGRAVRVHRWLEHRLAGRAGCRSGRSSRTPANASVTRGGRGARSSVMGSSSALSRTDRRRSPRSSGSCGSVKMRERRSLLHDVAGPILGHVQEHRVSEARAACCMLWVTMMIV